MRSVRAMGKVVLSAVETQVACHHTTLPFTKIEALNKLLVDVVYTSCVKSMSLTVNLKETRFSLSLSVTSPKRQMFPAKGH